VSFSFGFGSNFSTGFSVILPSSGILTLGELRKSATCSSFEGNQKMLTKSSETHRFRKKKISPKFLFLN
jgi:hypothetical protein